MAAIRYSRKPRRRISGRAVDRLADRLSTLLRKGREQRTEHRGAEAQAGRVNQPLTVRELLEAKGPVLKARHLNPESSLDREIGDVDVSGPGLALAGYLERFPSTRLQVFGETEMKYLASLGEDLARERLRTLFEKGVPGAFVSKGLDVPGYFLEVASAASVPVIVAEAVTREVFQQVGPYVEGRVAPIAHLHGSLADVYGVGVMLVGESGIGKSECVLDLVERGHRLVADDLVLAQRRGSNVVLGRGHPRQRHHMEIRGMGIVDVRRLFGVRAIRQQKRIEVVMQLVTWDTNKKYDRTGLERATRTILGVELPEITIPLNPGKNVGVICEVVAMDHLLRYTGVDAAREFNEGLQADMAPVRQYLEVDYE